MLTDHVKHRLSLQVTSRVKSVLSSNSDDCPGYSLRQSHASARRMLYG